VTLIKTARAGQARASISPENQREQSIPLMKP
jgi:hypothetical protein